MNPKDANGQIRNPPAILMRGDINMTKQLIHNINFSQRYTSGVLSWSEAPSEIDDATLDEVMNGFEAMVSAGLEKDRLTWLWVKHQDKGRVELHFVIPNVDLVSSKRFAPYFDRVDRARFRAWERLTNACYGFTDPSDPSRKKALQLPMHLPKDKQQATEAINFVVSALVRTQNIHNRDEVIQCLKKRGYEINRVGQDYISIKDAAGRKLRLCGSFYEDTFISPETIRAPITDTKEQSASDIQRLQIALEVQLKRRRDYIESRYPAIEINDIDGIAESLIKSTPSTYGEKQHDSIGKSSDASITEYSTAEQPALQPIEYAIREFERSAELFCSSIGHAIERIGRAIDQLRKNATNTYTY